MHFYFLLSIRGMLGSTVLVTGTVGNGEFIENHSATILKWFICLVNALTHEYSDVNDSHFHFKLTPKMDFCPKSKGQMQKQ